MNVLRRILLAVAVVSMLLSTAVPAMASQYQFSSQGLDDVLYWAASYKPSGVTTNEWAAVMLAVTWPETTGGTTNTPSPMTLGRADISQRLYAYSNNTSSNSHKRAFFHAGVGAWQIDSAGFASSLTTTQMIDTWTAALAVAQKMSSDWASAPSHYTKEQKRAWVWKPWVACLDSQNNGTLCEPYFDAIYGDINPNDTLYVTRDYNVPRLGGAIRKTCNLVGSSQTFGCTEINPFNALGHGGSWVYTPYDGAYSASYPYTGISPSPLTYTFYAWEGWYNGTGWEYRTWLRKDTSYSKHISTERQLGLDARSALTWYDSVGLCVNGVCP